MDARHEAEALYQPAVHWANVALDSFKKSRPAEHAHCVAAIAEGRLPFEVTIESMPPRGGGATRRCAEKALDDDCNLFLEQVGANQA